MSKEWMGAAPSKCDLCSGSVGKTFYDARMKSGQWANVCQSCFVLHGISLGVGYGQKYEEREGAWIKTSG